MADVAKKPQVVDAPEHKIRMTLTSTNVKMLEKVTSDFVDRANSRNLKAYGPIRMPTKTLRITTRKTPCGEGSKTWSRYQLRIHKRVLDLKSTSGIVKEITNINIDPIVTVEITVDDTMKNRLREQQEMKEAAAAEKVN